MTLLKLSKCFWCRGSCIIIRLQFKACRNLQLGCAVLLCCFTEVVGCVPPSCLCQFFKIHLLQLKPLHVLLYSLGDCAHHPAGFVIFAQLALLWLFIILMFPILPIIGTCKIAQTVSSSHHHLLKQPFGLSGCQSHVFSCPWVFLLHAIAASASSTCFLTTAVSLSTYSWIHFSFSALLKKWVSHRFSAASFYLDCKLRNATMAWTISVSKHIMAWFAWWRRCVDRFLDLLYLPCGTGEMFCFEALTIVVCVDFVVGWDVGCHKISTIWRQAVSSMSKVGTFTQLEQSKICVLTGNKTGILRITVQHNGIVSVRFMDYPGEFSRPTSADILSLEECSMYTSQS